MKRKMKLNLLLFLMLGFLIGYATDYLSFNGYHEPWVALPTPDSDSYDLVGVTVFGAIVNTESDELVVCNMQGEACSTIDEPDVNSIVDDSVLTCDLRLPATSFLTNAPADRVQCAQAMICWGEPCSEIAVVRDANNSLWLWENTPDGFLRPIVQGVRIIIVAIATTILLALLWLSVSVVRKLVGQGVFIWASEE